MQSSVEGHFAEFEEIMSRFQRVMQRHAAIKDFGLTSSQVYILRYLEKSPHAKASDIAKTSGLSPGAVTQVCDELVREGLVDRTRSQDDRRVVHVSITDSGRALVERFKEARREKMRFVLTQLGDQDAKEFVRIIGRIVDIVENNAPNE